jgi:hypothetical protein
MADNEAHDSQVLPTLLEMTHPLLGKHLDSVCSKVLTLVRGSENGSKMGSKEFCHEHYCNTPSE